ncbi:ROK family protein [Paenibacillus sp. strain BS8-2]
MRSAIGIDLGGTNLKWGIVSESGAVLLEGIEPTESHNGPEALLQKLSDIVAQGLTAANRLGTLIEGVGIGTAGQVERTSGIVRGATATLPGWAGMPLGERIQAETGLPVVVDNDVNMIALGEAWIGAGQAWDDFLCVAIGTGVGGCWIQERSVYEGREGYAGEFGHMVVSMNGLVCSCGNKGCWEAYASVSGFMRLACERWQDGPWDQPEEIFRLAKADDEEALSIVNAYCEYVAAGLSNLVHIFNPSAIVLAGAIVAGQGAYLLDRIGTALNRLIMPVYQIPAPVVLAPAHLGSQAGFVGSALAALKSQPRRGV